jgi:hypothetical protein
MYEYMEIMLLTLIFNLILLIYSLSTQIPFPETLGLQIQ